MSHAIHTLVSQLPIDHIQQIGKSPHRPHGLKTPSYGLDSPLGCASSVVFAPLYLYASLKGKKDVWDRLLADVPDDVFKHPVLDAGCGRGLVLLKSAQRKAEIDASIPATGMDIFSTADQSGNAPEATFANAEALGVLDHVALHTASFTTTLPFDDNHFALVTSSLAIHNVSAHERKVAVAELARITAPGGRIIILELMGYAQGYKETLRKVCGWQDVEVSMAGAEVMFGAWPCQVLAARKPTVAKS